MINQANQFKFLTLIAFFAGFAWCNVQEVKAQAGDPFAKAPYTKPRPTTSAPVTTVTAVPQGKEGKPAATTVTKVPVVKAPPPAPVPMALPPLQDRINFFKVKREEAARNGVELPKVTMFLALNEMSVSGIFKTPRGYAAMVEVKDLQLSYPIYPGEKFFDGQLVAIEENRLTFRKVTQWSNGKYFVTEENKPLRTYTEKEELQGTAPVDSVSRGESKSVVGDGTQAAAPKPVQPTIISPLDAMNQQPVEDPKAAKDKASEKGKKVKAVVRGEKSSTAKKPAKVAATKKAVTTTEAEQQ